MLKAWIKQSGDIHNRMHPDMFRPFESYGVDTDTPKDAYTVEPVKPVHCDSDHISKVSRAVAYTDFTVLIR